MDDIEDEYINKPSIKEENKKEDKFDKNENSEAPPSIIDSISENQSKISNFINDSNMNLQSSELNNIPNDNNNDKKNENIKLRTIKNKKGNENIEDKKDEKLLELKDVIIDVNKTPEIYNTDNNKEKKEDESKYSNKLDDNINNNKNSINI